MVQSADNLTQIQKVRLVRVLEAGFNAAQGAPDGAWLSRIESAQMGKPNDVILQYLAGRVCMRLSLWGKAQQLLTQSLTRLQDPDLQRDAWRALAQLAEQRNDVTAASEAYREAAKR
jgi:HemY protein